MAERTHYKVIIRCHNCGNKFEHYVKLGVTVSEHIRAEKIMCAVCECQDARLMPEITL